MIRLTVFITQLDLVNHRLRTENEADENASDKSNDRHQNIIADEIEEIKELHTENLHAVPQAVTERRNDTENDTHADNQKTRLRAAELQLVHYD